MDGCCGKMKAARQTGAFAIYSPVGKDTEFGIRGPPDTNLFDRPGKESRSSKYQQNWANGMWGAV
jgi:hypothetical protein